MARSVLLIATFIINKLTIEFLYFFLEYFDVEIANIGR